MSLNELLLQWLTIFFASGVAVESEIIPKQELTKELLKPIVREFEKRKVHCFL